jgi:hypothetical protein
MGHSASDEKHFNRKNVGVGAFLIFSVGFFA